MEKLLLWIEKAQISSIHFPIERWLQRDEFKHLTHRVPLTLHFSGATRLVIERSPFPYNLTHRSDRFLRLYPKRL